MKKLSVLIIYLLLIGNITCQINKQNPYVSELYEFLFSKSIQKKLDTKSSNNLYTTHNNELYVINKRGFENQTQNSHAEISKFNIITGVEETCLISPPPKLLETGINTNSIWIWAIATSDSLFFLAVDEEIWVYRIQKIMQYEYYKTIDLKNVFRLEIEDKNLHAFIDLDDGFDWFKIDLVNYEIKKVRKLELKNRFFLQIAPIHVLSIRNNALYFLQQNEPAIEKYSLTGKFMTKYSLKIPNWNSIPETVTKKLDSIKDVKERNYAFPRYSVFDYNFMHLFYVFPNERFFMMAMDRKNSADAYATPYFIQIVGDTTMVEPFSVTLDEKEKFGTRYFPFSTPRAEENVLFAHSNEYVTQINHRTNVLWNNKTQKVFQQEVNLYHRDNEPLEKIETYRLKRDYTSIDSIKFIDFDDNLFSFNDVKKEKAIFIVSQHPQCSVCIKAIWYFFSNISLPNVELYSVALDNPTYLMKKENIKEVNLYLKTNYTPLFIDRKNLNSVTKRILTQKANPIIILFDKKLQHIEIISANHIISDISGHLAPSFIHTIDNFVGK